MQPRTRRRLRWLCLAVGVLLTIAVYEAWPYWTADPQAEAARLEALLGLSHGMTVGEVGAGDGEMSVILAQRMGPDGHVFSTEIDKAKLEKIRDAAAEAQLTNVTVLEAGERETNLPAGCCDAVFMRRVYHHISDPVSLNRSLFQALKPGGRLAVIDFTSRFWLPKPGDVPDDRPGHGMPPDLLIMELTEAGFVLEHRIDDWPGRNYCVVARKP